MPSARSPAFRGSGLTITVASPSLENNAGNPAYGFFIRFTGRLPAELDNKHRNIAARLTARARENMEASILRPAERGSRPNRRLTGALFGGHGRKAAVRGEALNKGRGFNRSGTKVGKGVGWPVLIDLERRARHWRSLEFGAPYVTMPMGVFVLGREAQVPGGRAPDEIFMTLGEFFRVRKLRGGLRPRRLQSRRARRSATTSGRRSLVVGRERRGGPIEPKYFLTNAWNSIVGPNGERVAKEYQAVIGNVFGDFKSAR